MATVASIAALISTKVIANTNATADLALSVGKEKKITSGSIQFRQLAVVAGFDRRDSNISYDAGSFAITMVHYLSDATDVDTYLTGNALADQRVLMDPDFFRTIAGVYLTLELPEMDLPERVGNVIEYTVTVQLAIAA